jgi:cobalamin biosynthesis protein CobT
MDDFLEDFRVIHNSENGKVLTPREIVLCWEIYNRTWLDSATLTVIDRDGNDYTVDGFGRGSQEWLDMLYVMEDEEDTEEEEAEELEEEEEEEGDQADDEASTQEQEGEQEQEEESPATEEQVVSVPEQEAPLVASITLHNPEIVPEELVVNA